MSLEDYVSDDHIKNTIKHLYKIPQNTLSSGFTSVSEMILAAEKTFSKTEFEALPQMN